MSEFNRLGQTKNQNKVLKCLYPQCCCVPLHRCPASHYQYWCWDTRPTGTASNVWPGHTESEGGVGAYFWHTGWTVLMWRTCLQYGLPDPRQLCINIETRKWLRLWHPLQHWHNHNVTTLHPMHVWQMAGLYSECVKHVPVVNWMSLGIYFTRELMFRMKKAKFPLCLGCGEQKIELLDHLLLHCQNYKDIRENFIPKLILNNKSLQLFTPTGVKLLKLHLSYRYNAKMCGCMQFSSTIGTS